MYDKLSRHEIFIKKEKRKLLRMAARQRRILEELRMYGNIGYNVGATSVLAKSEPLRNRTVYGCNHMINGFNCGRHTVGIEDKCDLHL